MALTGNAEIPGDPLQSPVHTPEPQPALPPSEEAASRPQSSQPDLEAWNSCPFPLQEESLRCTEKDSPLPPTHTAQLFPVSAASPGPAMYTQLSETGGVM